MGSLIRLTRLQLAEALLGFLVFHVDVVHEVTCLIVMAQIPAVLAEPVDDGSCHWPSLASGVAPAARPPPRPPGPPRPPRPPISLW